MKKQSNESKMVYKTSLFSTKMSVPWKTKPEELFQTKGTKER